MRRSWQVGEGPGDAWTGPLGRDEGRVGPFLPTAAFLPCDNANAASEARVPTQVSRVQASLHVTGLPRRHRERDALAALQHQSPIL